MFEDLLNNKEVDLKLLSYLTLSEMITEVEDSNLSLMLNNQLAIRSILYPLEEYVKKACSILYSKLGHLSLLGHFLNALYDTLLLLVSHSFEPVTTEYVCNTYASSLGVVVNHLSLLQVLS